MSMTDEENELHIKSCGLLMLKAHAEGDFAARDTWLQLQNEAIRGRSAEQIAKMEDVIFCADGAQGRALG